MKAMLRLGVVLALLTALGYCTGDATQGMPNDLGSALSTDAASSHSDLAPPDASTEQDLAAQGDLMESDLSGGDLAEACPGWNVMPTTVDFGNVAVGMPMRRNYFVTNTSAIVGSTGSFRISGQSAGQFSTPELGNDRVAPGQMYAVLIVYQPFSKGPHHAQAVFNQGGCLLSVELTGNGI